MKRAFLVGKEPNIALGFEYVRYGDHEAVVIGSLEIGEMLRFQNPEALRALAEDQPVYLYTPGLPQVKNRSLAASLATAQRELKNWGVIFTDGGRKRLVTAQEAKMMRAAGQRPEFGAVLTPLAKEILEEMP